MWLVTVLNQRPPLLVLNILEGAAGGGPLSCHHLSSSPQGWHTSTVAMTLLGEDQVPLFAPALMAGLTGEEFLPSNPGVIDVPVSLSVSLIDFPISCLSLSLLCIGHISSSRTTRTETHLSLRGGLLLSVSDVTVSRFLTAIISVPVWWSNRAAMKLAGTITVAAITCDLVSHESSHDFRLEDWTGLYMEICSLCSGPSFIIMTTWCLFLSWSYEAETRAPQFVWKATNISKWFH